MSEPEAGPSCYAPGFVRDELHPVSRRLPVSDPPVPGLQVPTDRSDGARADLVMGEARRRSARCQGLPSTRCGAHPHAPARPRASAGGAPGRGASRAIVSSTDSLSAISCTPGGVPKRTASTSRSASIASSPASARVSPDSIAPRTWGIRASTHPRRRPRTRWSVEAVRSQPTRYRSLQPLRAISAPPSSFTLAQCRRAASPLDDEAPAPGARGYGHLGRS